MATSRNNSARFEIASDQSLIVYFEPPEKPTRSKGPSRPGQNIRKANEKVRKLLRLLELEPISGVHNLHPAYSSLLVKFDGLHLRHEELQRTLNRYLQRAEKLELPEPRHVEVPVCYGGEYGPDLTEVSDLLAMTPEQVIQKHCAVEYQVYFLGFVPGFAYLGELPQELVTPRLPAPRRKVPAGSVGIAGNQTGVYPFPTPGGWRLLGRTPMKMFRVDSEELSALRIGNRVRFAPISPERFAELQTEWA